jgi:hypothetical protein
MTFKPGQSGNPKGRTPGRRNAKTRAVLEKLNGVADALALLGEMVASAEAPLALRVTAATALAPYQYPKAPRLLRKKIDLPEPVTIEDATANIARIGVFAAARRIGLDEANDLVNFQKAYIEARIGCELEQRIATLEHALQNAHINLGVSVVGGMPPLPGTTIDMPQLTAAPSRNERDRADGPVLGGDPVSGGGERP